GVYHLLEQCRTERRVRSHPQGLGQREKKTADSGDSNTPVRTRESVRAASPRAACVGPSSVPSGGTSHTPLRPPADTPQSPAWSSPCGLPGHLLRPPSLPRLPVGSRSRRPTHSRILRSTVRQTPRSFAVIARFFPSLVS